MSRNTPKQYHIWDPDIEDDEEAMIAAAVEESRQTAQGGKAGSSSKNNDQLSEGIAAALARLRENG